MKRFLLLLGMSILLLNIATANSYTWNATNGIWTVAGNWSPSRTTPATDDILIFNGGIVGQCTANTIPPQQIGELKVINGCTAMFESSSNITLTVSTPGFAFLVDSTSQLIYFGTNQIVINLPIVSTGTVQGDVVFNNGNGLVAHILSSATANGITFTNGASFQYSPAASNANNPFGSGVSNSIVFQSGATYYMSGNKTTYSGFPSGDPFGGAGKSVTSFQHGSLFYVYDPADMSFSGRTVSNVTFDVQANGTSIGDTTSPPWVVTDTCRFKSTSIQVTFGGTCPVKIGADLVIESMSGGLKDNPLSLTTTSNFEVQGNFNQGTGTFTPSINVNRVYLLDGSGTQTFTLGTVSTIISNLSVNNSSGIILGSNVSIISTLTMSAGNINTGSNNLVLGVSTTQIGILNQTSGTIIGEFTRWVSALTTGTYTFPIGTASNFNEATINFTVPPTTGGTLTTFFTVSNPGTLGLPTTDGVLTLDTVNPAGFWTISAGNGLNGGTYNVTLEANGFTFIGSTTNARIMKRANGSSPWNLAGSDGTNSGVAIVRTGLSGFSDFGIAESYLSLPPSAGFTANLTSGFGALTVNFSDTSLNSPTSWSWTFGDGSTSNTQNPQHVYLSVPTTTYYSVQLIVANSFGTTTSIKPNYITVTEPPPSIASLLTPLNNVTTFNSPLLFSWSTSTDIVGSTINYILQLGLDSVFTSIVTTINSISTTSQTLSSLPNGVIYWHVQAASSFGTTGSAAQEILLFDTTDQRVVVSSETVTFYVGDTIGVYLPVTIFFTSTNTDTVTVTNINSQAPSLPTSYYMPRYWIITPTVTASNLTATITFSYTSTDYLDSGVTLESDLVPSWDTTGSGAWSSITTGVTVDTVNHVLTVSGITHFSNWTLGGPNGAIPVELSDFEIVDFREPF